MLSYDSLAALSRERGLPAGKLRGAVREYAQLLSLKALYSQPAARGLAFLGGTALRLGFNLPRFSEDLDFDARDLSLKDRPPTCCLLRESRSARRIKRRAACSWATCAAKGSSKNTA